MGIWNTTDYKGQPVTWYSADIIEKIKEIIKRLYYKDLVECEKSLDEILDELHEILDIIENGGAHGK